MKLEPIEHSKRESLGSASEIKQSHQVVVTITPEEWKVSILVFFFNILFFLLYFFLLMDNHNTSVHIKLQVCCHFKFVTLIIQFS